ncbi:chalcone isomerase family protein [Kangiella sediminilitoris]|uniref:Chalcone isomerase domain-containing protein n=1 Tax=Kangiella sediminilitoris TaxID=1144748 RepID=A0A1B3B846_9GAMM|nr:chalcone isomerase family protein [Kangiella sediminilitoris]AOE48963.1 hypothetical protein KS2013_235 [Kangiella sediminilitoris]
MIYKLFIVTGLLFSSAVFAELPASINHNNQTFELCAQEKVTKGIFFDIVNVGIYYKNCGSVGGIFDDETKLLRFAYLREVEGQQFTEGAIEYLEENLSPEEKQRCFDRYSQLNNSYKDVSDGDYYDLYLIKDEGLKLYLNNQYITEMTDTSCDSEYLKVWFGKESMDSQFQELHEKLKSNQSLTD